MTPRDVYTWFITQGNKVKQQLKSVLNIFPDISGAFQALGFIFGRLDLTWLGREDATKDFKPHRYHGKSNWWLPRHRLCVPASRGLSTAVLLTVVLKRTQNHWDKDVFLSLSCCLCHEITFHLSLSLPVLSLLHYSSSVVFLPTFLPLFCCLVSPLSSPFIPPSSHFLPLFSPFFPFPRSFQGPDGTFSSSSFILNLYFLCLSFFPFSFLSLGATPSSVCVSVCLYVCLCVCVRER